MEVNGTLKKANGKEKNNRVKYEIHYKALGNRNAPAAATF
jgi:hypothetical protein